MDLYSCLEKEFSSGNYKAAVRRWEQGGRQTRSDHY